MKIPLPELGLDCEKKDIENVKEEYEEINNIGYNTRTAENEKSVLFIDEEKLGRYFQSQVKSNIKWEDLGNPHRDAYILKAKRLIEHAKSFMRIEKEN